MRTQEAISKFLKYMEYIQSASPQTLRAYQSDLIQCFGSPHSPKHDNFSEKELLAAYREAFQTWKNLSLSSRNRKAATLKSFYSWAFSENLTDRNLSLQVPSPKVPKKLPHFISVDEALSVLHALNQSTGHSHHRVLFLLLYGGGLRVSEACQLRWKQVEFQQRYLRIQGKGGKERLVILPQGTLSALKKWKAEQIGHEEYIFGDSALNPRTAYSMIRQCGELAGLLKPLHPHALRHSFATHLLSSGANLRTLQELLGHESLRATEKYTHLGIDQLARTMEALHPLGRKKN